MADAVRAPEGSEHQEATDPMTASEAQLPGHWLSEAAQLAFFDQALARTGEAEARAGCFRHQIEFAGTRIELAFAGETLSRLFLPALQHLLVPADRRPDATFHVWDSASTGVAMVPPPCKPDGFTDRGDIWGMSSERNKSAFHWSEYSVNLMDLERHSAIFWVQSADQLPYWSKASPFRTLFHWWMERCGGQLLHAAAVGNQDGAVLVTARGGAGKSSLALSCLAAGMQYVADDYLVVRLDPEPRVFSLYSTAKLDLAQVREFPTLSPLVTNPGAPATQKAVLGLYPRFATQVARSLPLKLIATPSFHARKDTGFRPADAARLERAAAFTTLSQLPHAGRNTHRFIQRMVASLPGVELLLGSDLQQIPAAIQELLRLAASDDPALTVTAPQARAAARPLISVIIPVYNGTRFLPEAIANVLTQRYDALELIVVDDGSTDDPAAVLQQLSVDVRYFRQDNAGAAAARNRGIKDASGDLLAFLDVDDLWPEENLDVLCRLLEQDPALDAVHGRAQLTRYSGAGQPGEYLGNPKESFSSYIGAGLYRRRAFERVGLFDPELLYGEDTDWFNRAGECGLRLARLDEVTLFVRRHGENMTRGKSLVERNLLRVLKKQLDRRPARQPPPE
jgi:glycosyl transferase family 2